MITETDTFCILPWSHIFFWPNGDTNTCCDGSINLGKARDGLLKKMNSETMLEIRKAMLEGRWHPNCTNCKRKEEAGFKSSRTSANFFYKKGAIELIGDAINDIHLDNPKLFNLELRLNNLCNFKCRTCDHDSSSAWYEEELALYKKGLRPKAPIEKIQESHLEIESLLPILEYVKKIEFVGGEPFLDKRVSQIIRTLIDLNRTDDILLSFITNMSRFDENEEIVQLLKQFKNTNIIISLDGYGSRAEYIRHGTKWPQIEKNLDYFLDSFSDKSYYHIHFTYSLFNAQHVVDFHKWITTQKGVPLDRFVFNLALGPDYITADKLPDEIKIELINSYQNYQNTWPSIPKNTVRNSFDGPIQYLTNSLDKFNLEELKTFFKHVDFLDKSRGESFEGTFPEWKDLRSYITSAPKN